MPRTDIPITDIPFQGSLANIVAGGVAGDAANDHEMVNDGSTLIAVHNGSGGVVNATVVSVADQLGRTGDDPKAIAAGDTAIFGPYRRDAWNQPGGKIHLDLDVDTSVTVAGVRPARTP